MRSDLNKLLCEHERRGSWRKFRHVRHNKKFRLNDDSPARESMKIRHEVGYNTKEFGEFLSPLKGQIRKAVGRPYDKFYGELCRNFDMSLPVNSHLLVHLDQYLIPSHRILRDEKGELWVKGEHSMPPRPLGSTWHRDEYYVDPKDGIIKKVKHRRVQEKPKPVTTAQVDKDHVLHLIDGTWFVFTLVDCPSIKKIYVKPEGKDTFDYFGKLLTWERLADWQKHKFGVMSYSAQLPYDEFLGKQIEKGRYHTNRRTASKKMLRDAGLRP